MSIDIEDMPSVKIGLDDFYGKQTVLKALEQQQAEIERLKSSQLPLELTAENEAKGLLSGEFYETIEQECPECYLLTEPFEDCDICKGFGSGLQKITISWTNIKNIYKKWVDYRLPKPPEVKND